MKNFGYGSILTAFDLEKIPLVQPQYIALDLPSLTKPRMQRWVDHMSRHAGQSQISFSDTFFGWFDRQEMVFSEYPYAGMDFRGDPDLVLLAGEQWGAIGKFFDHIPIYRFSFIMSLCFILSRLIKLMCSCRCWSRSASSTLESASCRPSMRGCWKGYPSRP